MSQELDKISQFMGAAEGVPPPERNRVDEVKDLTRTLRDVQKENYEKDYGDARNNLKEIVEESMSLLPSVVVLAREAETASMYLAASSFIKALSDLNKDLLSISQVKDSGTPARQLAAPTVEGESKAENTTIYIGTSEEVFKQFSRRNKGKAEDTPHEGDFIVIEQPKEESTL
jgi:hypothetical protein